MPMVWQLSCQLRHGPLQILTVQSFLCLLVLWKPVHRNHFLFHTQRLVISHWFLALECKAMPELILQLQPACVMYGQQ